MPVHDTGSIYESQKRRSFQEKHAFSELLLLSKHHEPEDWASPSGRRHFAIAVVIGCLQYLHTGRAFVREWARLRWGVFDEYNNKEKFYLASGKNEAVRYACFNFAFPKPL